MYWKVKKQFKHAISCNDDICKFNCLWISFNCFYNIIIVGGTDRQKIEKIKNNTEIKQVFLWLTNTLKNDFFEFINNRPNRWWVKNLSNNNIVTYLCLDCFWEFLEIIYTIRNNQFHWWKDWESEDDLLLLTRTNIIFETFLNNFYCKHSIIN